MTPELLSEGIARELIHAVQNRRKDLACNYTDRVELAIVTDEADILTAVRSFKEYIQTETLAVEIATGPLPGVEPQAVKIGSAAVQLYVKVVVS